METFAGLLDSHKEVINYLNVYPVPDGDTGTNMALTLASVVSALGELPADAPMASVKKAIAHGSLMGARGNSGVILSQLLRGLVAEFEEEVTAGHLLEALANANRLAREAVVRPIEGTILSVALGAVEGAREHSSTLEAVVRGALDGAQAALAHTPEQLDVLKKAGVVDSGGTGLVLFFDALATVLYGDPLPEPPAVSSITRTIENIATGYSVAELSHEVMFLLSADDAPMLDFRASWAEIGDSIVIVGGDGLFNCHIHTDDVDAAVAAGESAGTLSEIRITKLSDVDEEVSWVAEGNLRTPAPHTAVVAVALGAGTSALMSSLGAREVVSGGQTMNPSTADLVAAVLATGSAFVAILPNNKNIIPVAEQVNGLVEVEVSVVATTSVVEGLAALIAYRPDASLAQNINSMNAAKGDVTSAEVTQSVRGTVSDVGEVKVGDWIGLGPEGISSIGESVLAASSGLLNSVLTPTSEILTIIEGSDAHGDDTAAILRFVAETFPEVEVEVHRGGQPLYPYYFGIE
jgi:DAK2 domain fusion protein YloV